MDDTSITQGEPVRQFSIFLQNTAGALLGIVRLVNDAMSDVLGISVQDSADGTIVRLVVSDPDSVETMFIEKGIAHVLCEIVAVQLKEVTELSRCLSALRMAETNVHFCYPLMSRPNDRPVLALFLEDVDFGTSVLSSNGFKLLYQNDLSR